MSNSHNGNYKIYTLSLIQNDCETLKKIMSQFNDPFFWMELVTYMALFSRSLQEYFDIPMISEEIDSEIYDIRNSIKLYGERYGKSKNSSLNRMKCRTKNFGICFVLIGAKNEIYTITSACILRKTEK